MYLADLLTIQSTWQVFQNFDSCRLYKGLPVGLRLIGPKYSEESHLFRAAAAFEADGLPLKQQPLIFGGDN